MLEFKIRKIENGYIVSWEEENENSKNIKLEEVIEEREDEKESLKKLLERTAIFFGFNYDRWSESNLNITFNKIGHKCNKETKD